MTSWRSGYVEGAASVTPCVLWSKVNIYGEKRIPETTRIGMALAA